MGFLLLLAFLFFLLYVAPNLMDRRRDLKDYWSNATRYRHEKNLTLRRLSADHELLLLRNNPYYSRLDQDRKNLFQKRLYHFLNSHQFEGRKGLVVTAEMKIAVGAAAVQLTFGLRNPRLDFFKTIIIYPESYYSTVRKGMHKGEVNTQGVIVFSWKDFQQGFRIEDDKLNLGLHEMAHALAFQHFFNDEYDYFFAAYLEKIYHLGKEELRKISSRQPHFFREYAGTNLHEFFAVSVEYFFEAPDQFAKELPELFRNMTILLHQDPRKGNPLQTEWKSKGKSRRRPGRAHVVLGFDVVRASLFLLPLLLFAWFVNYAIWVPDLPFERNVIITGFLALVFLMPYTAIGYTRRMSVHEEGVSIQFFLRFFRSSTLIIPYEDMISVSLFSRERAFAGEKIRVKYLDGDQIKKVEVGVGVVGRSHIVKALSFVASKKIRVKSSMDNLDIKGADSVENSRLLNEPYA